MTLFEEQVSNERSVLHGPPTQDKWAHSSPTTFCRCAEHGGYVDAGDLAQSVWEMGSWDADPRVAALFAGFPPNPNPQSRTGRTLPHAWRPNAFRTGYDPPILTYFSVGDGPALSAEGTFLQADFVPPSSLGNGDPFTSASDINLLTSATASAPS